MKQLLIKHKNDSGDLVVRSFFQIKLFGKVHRLFNKERTIEQCDMKDDYINIRIPKYGDVPIVMLQGEIALKEDEGLESVKFIWVTKTFDEGDFNIPFVDVKTITMNDPYKIHRGFGDEHEAEYKRNQVARHNDSYDRFMNIINKSNDDDVPTRPEVSE